MEYKNARYTIDGKIDCEVNHPKYGWIPFTASPDDTEQHSRKIFASAKSSALPYVPPPEPSADDILERERAAMKCSPAQMRLTLHRAGLLDQVQAIADADPEASLVWEYATEISRQSPLIEELGGDNGFTPEQIDDLFRQAMKVAT